MNVRSLLSSAVALAVVVPTVASAQAKPAMTFKPASPKNYSNNRGAKIDRIVIHKVEGTLDSCVSWFRNPAAKVSAHYVVDGSEIVQMLADSKRAWHSGNPNYNARAIGIENAGFTNRNDVTDAHYRRLASLVSYLCRVHGIPADRRFVMGHNEVPNPNRPGKFGGTAGKTDPGPYFDWNKLMTYVRQAMGSPVTAPPPALSSSPVSGSPAGSSGAIAAARAVSVRVAALNVRNAAWGTIIGTAPANTAWVRTGRTDQGFVEIYYRGGQAWVHSNYVTGYSGPGCRIMTAGTAVREGASSASHAVGTASPGQIYSRGGLSSDGAWVTIRFDQERRWIYRSSANDVTLTP